MFSWILVTHMTLPSSPHKVSLKTDPARIAFTSDFFATFSWKKTDAWLMVFSLAPKSFYFGIEGVGVQ